MSRRYRARLRLVLYRSKGILSIADVLGRLNDFAEVFVLVYEIDHEVRGLIRDVRDEARLQ